MSCAEVVEELRGERRGRGGRRRAGRADRSSTPASGLPNGRRTVMVCWRGCLSSRRRSTGRCWSGRRASRSCGRRPAIGRRRERDWGTAAAVTAAVLAGAHIVRVHAVAEMVQVVRVAEEIRRAGLGLRLRATDRHDRQPELSLTSCHELVHRIPPPSAHRLVGSRRHPRGVDPDLRGPQAHSRHARRADGARRRRARRRCSTGRAGGTSRPSTG